MKIDDDINQLLVGIESGSHPIEKAIGLFLESLPGYDYRLHSSPTVNKYEACLKKGPNCLLRYMHSRGISSIEQTKKEDAEQYKDFLLNHLDPQTVRSFMTATRLLFQYVHRLGWIKEDFSIGMHLPKPRKKEHIKTLSPEVTKQVLSGEWGTNSFAIARNHLIAILFIKRGLHPKEFPTILEEHIHPYEDLAYVTVYGKRGVPRDVMLDPETLDAWRIYMVERAHFMYVKKIRTKNIFLSLNPMDDSYTITTSGVQSIVRRIKQELKLKGCLWDLSALNAQGCRRTAVSNDYEIAEDSPIHHPEFTLCGQYGHSLAVAQKYYWRRSLKNAYRFIKGSPGSDRQEQPQKPPMPPNPASQQGSDLRKIFPESSFFRDFGVGI